MGIERHIGGALAAGARGATITLSLTDKGSLAKWARLSAATLPSLARSTPAAPRAATETPATADPPATTARGTETTPATVRTPASASSVMARAESAEAVDWVSKLSAAAGVVAPNDIRLVASRLETIRSRMGIPCQK